MKITKKYFVYGTNKSNMKKNQKLSSHLGDYYMSRSKYSESFSVVENFKLILSYYLFHYDSRGLATYLLLLAD